MNTKSFGLYLKFGNKGAIFSLTSPRIAALLLFVAFFQ
jgi:hypothetical protein